MRPTVIAVSRSPSHAMAKQCRESIQLLKGAGVEGDIHAGATVRHRSRAKRDPTQPNLRQLHLLHSELHDELRSTGFSIAAGEMGENITTRGIDLLALPVGTLLYLGDFALVKVTGLRNPCSQLDGLCPGLMKATLSRGENGEIIRKAGIMAIVTKGGEVRPGDAIRVDFPAEPHRELQVV